MDFHLVVVRPFGSYLRGDIIADMAKVSTVLKSEHAHAVVRVVTPTTMGA